jgi:hypothetical protein
VFHALHEVATAAAGGTDPGQIAQLAATHCRNLLDADGIGVRWLEEAAGELRLLAAAARQPTDHPASMPLHGSLVGRAVLEGRSIICDDYRAESGALDWAGDESSATGGWPTPASVGPSRPSCAHQEPNDSTTG